jgi:hypothetical protein
MDTDLTAKIPTFNSDVKNFMLWLVRSQVFAVMKKFIRAIQVVGDADLPAEETVFDTDAAKKKKEEQVCFRILQLQVRSCWVLLKWPKQQSFQIV